MLDKFPVLEEGYTFLIQPFGGHIYLAIDFAEKIGISGHRHDINIEGAAVLRRCTGLKSVRNIVDEICVEFDDVADSVEPKVVDFLKIVEEKGYVCIQDAPRPTKGFIRGASDYVTPFKALIEVTSACNLRCVHCFADCGVPHQNELSKEQIFGILGKMHEIGTEGLNISGGEPLLRKDLLEILDYCHGKFAFSLLTNGTLVDDEFSKRFADYTTSPIQISLYGYNPKDHDAVTRVPGSFKATIKGIKSLVRHGIYVMVAYLYRPGNLNYIREMTEFCADLEVAMFRVGLLAEVGRGRNPKWDISNEEYFSVSTKLKELGKDYDGRMEIQSWSPGGEMSLEERVVPEKEHLKCQIGSHSIVIGSNGDLMPCGLIRWKFGNLLRDDPRELFSMDHVQFFSSIEAPSPFLCGDCEFLYKCRKCHGEALTHFYRVKECHWAAQFKNAPEIIQRNLQEAVRMHHGNEGLEKRKREESSEDF
jgi:radical SAM protein with 4Fe4S-binding SPASM domain